MENTKNNRKEDIYKLQKKLRVANDKKYLDLIAGLYIENIISTEVFLEYLTKNLSYPEILDTIESNNIQPGGGRKREKNTSCMEMPLFSVIIPTHGESLCIKKTIDSVLCQTYKNIEIIILDDYGNNQKKNFIFSNYKAFTNINRIKYYQSKHGKKTGPEKRKYGFHKANGEYVIFLDHDDFYLDSLFFERAVSFFEKRGTNGKKQKEIFSCYGSNAFIYQEISDSYEIKKLNVSGSYTGEEYLYGWKIKYDKPLSLFSSVFVKEKIDNYKDSILLEDSCIYMAACLNGNIYISDNIIGAYRIWDNNYTKSLHFELILPVIEAKMKIAEKAKNIYFGKDWDKWSLKQAELSFDYSYKNSTYMTYKDLLYMELWGFYKFKNRFMDMGKYYLAKKITENINYPFSDITILQKKLNRAKSYYEILNLWLINKNMGKHVSDYFIKHGYKRISIYGYGEIGKMFFEELSQNKDIDIVSIIDNMFTYRDLEINEKYYRLNNELPETDIIVITPVFAFKNIAKDLKKHGINNYISIEEIFIKD